MTAETNKIHRLYPVEQAHKTRVLYESWSARLVAYAFVFILTLSYALVSDLLLGVSTKTVTLGSVAIATFLIILSPVVYGRILRKKNEKVHAGLKKTEMDFSAKKEKLQVRSEWANGAFYLFMFIVVIAGVGILATHVMLYVLLAALIAAVLFVPLIGAFQLRQDDRLAEKSFLELMKLIIRQLPLLGRFANK